MVEEVIALEMVLVDTILSMRWIVRNQPCGSTYIHGRVCMSSVTNTRSEHVSKIQSCMIENILRWFHSERIIVPVAGSVCVAPLPSQALFGSDSNDAPGAPACIAGAISAPPPPPTTCSSMRTPADR